MLLRPLTPGDAAQVQAFVRGLSSRSRYERFFTSIAELSPKQLERITAGAGFSIGAFDAAGRLVGLAEYARSSELEAEFAIVVADELQGQGLGAQLVGALLEHAKRSGIARLAGVTHTRNRAMRLLARRLGFGVQPDEDPDLVRMELAFAA
jgi:RimJ/RimL family protein N-acetyltransferase